MESEQNKDNHSLIGKAVDRLLIKYDIERASLFDDPNNIKKSTYFGLRNKWVDETSDNILNILGKKESSKFKQGLLLCFLAIDEDQISKKQDGIKESMHYRAVTMALDKLFAK